MANTKSFIATVTPASIEKGNTAKGARYTKMSGATVASIGKGGKTVERVRTVMAFGRDNAAVARILRVGKAVQVACVWDGGTVRIVGKAPTKKAA